MQKLIHSYWFGPVVSGVLTFIAICQVNFWVNWVCYVPLFISISKATPAAAFKKGLLFGAVLSFVAYFWMIPGAQRFTGGSMWYGVLVIAISLLVMSLYHGGLLWFFSWVKNNNSQSRSTWKHAVLMACTVTVGEALLMIATGGLPWFDEHSGSGLSDNLYSIQPAVFFGVPALTFVAVLVNYLAADSVTNKTWRKLYIPFAVIGVYMVSGAILLSGFSPQTDAKPFAVAILSENLPPELKWNDTNANELAQGLVDLNAAAITLKPEMMLWSESGIPWTYKPDDALIREVIRITKPVGATHILGINTAGDDKSVFNSAYYLSPDGQVGGRYDKQHLLAFIERPVSGWIIPFLSSGGYFEKTNTAHAAPLSTPYGKAGIMMCNESIIPAAAASMVNDGAQFLLNMSNDGWFNNTYMVRVHFLRARLRAVETRKDLVINSNNGYCGLIKASGQTESIKKSEEPFVEAVTVQPNNDVPLTCRLPNLFVYGCAGYLLITIIMKRYINYRIKATLPGS